MASFRGSYDYSVDPKGRVNVPAKFRKMLSPEAEETFVIVRGPHGCLRAYPLDTWENYENELAERPETEENLWYIRQLRNSLSDSTLDAQGRITLGAAQMKSVGISQYVTIVGMVKYMEIWDRGEYQRYLESLGDFSEAYFKSVEAGITGR